MPVRNWVSFAPVGAGIVVVLMLLASALVNHRHAYECALDATAAACRAPPGGVAASPLPAATPAADRVARLIQSSGGDVQGLLTAHFSLYLLGASLVMLAASLAVVLAVARQQGRIERAQRATDDAKAADTQRMLRLVESVATVIRALEERTRELEAGVEAFANGSAAHERGLAAAAAVLVKVREEQRAGGRLAAETAGQLDRAVASMADEVGNFRRTLADDLLPSISRRDERLVAIDASLTAVADRLSRLSADAQHHLQETAVLTEVVRALERSLSGVTHGSADIGRPPRHSPEPGVAPARPMSDDEPGGGPESAEAALSDGRPTDDTPDGRPKDDV